MILEQIKGPEDLKKLTSEELSQLKRYGPF